MGPARTGRPRAFWGVAALLGLLLVACGSDDPAADETTTTSATEPSGPAGPIAFQRGTVEDADIYAVDLDGGNEQRLYEGPAELGRWSPDGTELAIFCCPKDDGMVAHILDVTTRELRGLPSPDETLELHCGFAWSPDGKRLACETFGFEDGGRNGIYSLSTTDGGDLTRITSNPGGDDIPGDYSPDGSKMVFLRFVDDEPIGVFVTNLDGSGLRQLTPKGMVLDEGFGGRWSPDGTKILLVARPALDAHKAIWVVDPAGGQPTLLEMDPACGGSNAGPQEHGCYSPSWSPDGTQIVFTRSESSGAESIYAANADGTDVVPVTDGNDDHPVWGANRP